MPVDKSRTVFIVDDNDLSRHLLRGILRDSPLEIAGETTTGENAVEIVAKLRPDIVFLDIILPGMDGIAVLRALKEQHPGIIVLMITSEPRGNVVREAIAYGADGLLVKPFNAARVLESVAHAIAQQAVSA